MNDTGMAAENEKQPNLTVHVDESDSENEELENEADNAEVESSLELDRPGAPVDAETTEPQINIANQPDDTLPIHTMPEPAHTAQSFAPSPTATSNPGYANPHVVAFEGLAGCPVSSQSTSNNVYQSKLPTTSIYHPFSSQLEWEIARWAKLHGHISASAVTELLSIKGVTERLGLKFKNSNELNKIIDDQLPSMRPAFQQVPFELDGEVFELYLRDIVACVEALFGDPEFALYLKYAPEQHFIDESCSIRLYHDMHTGEWWWATQQDLDAVKPGGTIIPIILSSDKTQLTLFRNKSAYPLYMTIGNIPKEIRRRPSCQAYVLLGYLPTSRLLHINNQAARRRCLLNIYHSCMSKILAPLKEIGLEGRNMANGDGIIRRAHLLYALFIGDYPEQVQATCVITGDCVACPTPHSSLGNYNRIEAADSWRPLNDLLDAIDAIDEDPVGFQQLAKELRVKPVDEPFWKDLPFAHIYRSITPDVLHQLYQGLVKHVVGWITEACGAAEIDARCRRLPPNHNTHTFLKGITSLSRVSGKEHAAMCQILLGLLTDIRLPNGVSNIPLQRAVRALLDFVYLAQYPVHTTQTLRLMEDALEAFHHNKHIFVTLGIREHFNIPKLHFASHYARCIKLFGTTDNFNTEYTERLHIDLAKDAYRATNHKDEFSQMVRWLERKEKMSRHAQHIEWRLTSKSHSPSTDKPSSSVTIWTAPSLDQRRFLKMTSIRSNPPPDTVQSTSSLPYIALPLCVTIRTSPLGSS
ncbi:hypothetical protein EST38_g3624 [Candolleomyces aberdarensis]|uniref:Uncharacterized protein n=1 Tax=Candolleomyces aberdarensis TaxID=2316362 RepID=A0A4Q2DRK8_9AGAR|nr:hypothetical protein EST38_g3624 [Candolleomyces aberdarensis]